MPLKWEYIYYAVFISCAVHYALILSLSDVVSPF